MQLTNIALNQDKLNVIDKSRSNIFNWRGQFTPEFVDYLLLTFSKECDIVIDPFAGSGTVLHECARHNLSCYGFEINPAAYAMSKFFTLANQPLNVRQLIASNLGKAVFSALDSYGEIPLIRKSQDYREKFSNLIDFAKSLFSIIGDKTLRLVAINMLFIAESRKNGNLQGGVNQAYNYIKSKLFELPFTEQPIHAYLCDARETHKKITNRADLVITSPPYINVFNYHQNYRALLEGLGWDLLKVAKCEMGSNRKNRGNRFKTVIQYCLEIEQSLNSLWHCLNDNSLIVLVIGRESNVRGIPFYNGSIIKEIMHAMGCFQDIANYERHFINRFGNKIKEDIIVCKKTSLEPEALTAREISRSHLKHALLKATGDVKKDIEEAIDQLYDINSSEVFNGKEVYNSA